MKDRFKGAYSSMRYLESFSVIFFCTYTFFKVLPNLNNLFSLQRLRLSASKDVFYCLWLYVTTKVDLCEPTIVLDIGVAERKLRSNNLPKHA